MPETAQLTVQLDLKGNLTSGITKAQGQLNGLAKSAGRVGKGVGQVGAGFARAGLVVGGAAITGLVGAAKAGIEFEDAFAGVIKTVDSAQLAEAGMSFEGLAKSFREMATEIPISAVQFAELGETAGALGVHAKDIEEFVEVTALMGVTTNLSANEAADAFGRIGTILGLTGDDYRELADSIVAVGNAGASTEAEITEIVKRFAAQAKQVGLTKEEMVGLASATAGLGFEPERGGTALARVFANMSTNIALANSKGKTFAKFTGKSIKEMQRDLNRGDGLELFTDFLYGIKDLSATDAAKVLKAAGVTNTSDRTIFQAMADQLPFVNKQLEIAENATGELLEEAEKKFATVASSIQIFKNNIIEAGITLSEGFLPAVGRSLDKLSSALKDPANKGELKKLGEEIGAALDDIDWQNVLDGAKSFVGVLKTTLSVTLSILETLNKLPTEIKAAAGALLVLNKASGGLIGAGVGNIVGGVAETAIRGLGSKLPKVGSLFAQPVFVTNWPMGGLGGGLPGAAGKGGGFNPLSLVPLVAVAGLELAVAEAVGPPLRKLIGVTEGGLGDVTAEIGDIKIISGQSQAAVAHQAPPVRVILPPSERNPNPEKPVVSAIEATSRNVDRAGTETKGAIVASAALTGALLGSQTASLFTTSSATQGAVRGVAPPIVGAIRAIPRPVTYVNVSVSATSVSRTVTVVKRYGSPSGSRNQDSDGSGTLGNGGQ